MKKSVYRRGDHLVLADRCTYRVIDVMARLTPYRRAGQDTKVVGYTYGLEQIANYPLLDAVPFVG